MELKRKPKLLITLLIGGTLLLAGGGAVAATLPAPSRMMTMVGMREAHSSPSATVGHSGSTTAPASLPSQPSSPIVGPSTGSTPSTLPSAPADPTPSLSPSAAPPLQAPVTYVVKAGDTLSGIADWFKLHGYGALYAANMAVIGANPNLIIPGERITISGDGVMTVAGPA